MRPNSLHYLISLALLSQLNPADAQQKKTYNVAIVVHEGVELFDFAGPGEVFAAASRSNDVANIKVFTVAPTKDPVVSQTFLSINPNYSIDDAPRIDILVIPGGRTGVLLNDEKFMAWVKELEPKTDNLLTVCTGAFVPAKLGLLDGLKATTHHGSIASLKSGYPKVTVIEEEKFVDNGHIITSGGVSSGTEGALHMIQRIAGLKAARGVARYMEYDHWSPDKGLMAYENEAIKKLKNLSVTTKSRDGMKSDFSDFEKELNSVTAGAVDFGELEAYADELLENNQSELSLMVFKRLSELYPWSIVPFDRMTEVSRETGKNDTPPTEEEFISLIKEDGIEAAAQSFETWQKKYPGWKIFGESALNVLGYKYLYHADLPTALGIFQLNVKAYPKSWNAWDSLAEGYLKSEDYPMARKYYNKSLELNPENTNATKMLEQIATQYASK
ncbi:DJ-1/PfpI family protein [Marinoscillum sp.]|uniref:DJ-1/PfpI family protein n=1 Tax=Marinoscillum sp. TaxID=2024838 RepID=UPI003BAA9D53